MASVDPPSYVEAHRYDGVAIQHDRIDVVVPCAVQPRDVAILRDVWRYKFLTAPQLRELWWPDRTERAGQHRLRKLVRAGYLERFRPISRKGSFPWTYKLSQGGHRLLQRAGVIGARERFNDRIVYDYGHILHEIQLNAWVLAYRAALGPALLEWEGETHIEPPSEIRRKPDLRLEDDWSVEGLRDPRARPVRPDAVLVIKDESAESQSSTFLIEFDRTRRVDKNFEKFRRYDAFLVWWWRHTRFSAAGEPPFVVFVCQTEHQRDQFLVAADRELTGRHLHPGVSSERHNYVARRRLLFALEHDTHSGRLAALRVPVFPSGHPARSLQAAAVRLPGSNRRRATV
jgi:protein involved in plasmid replication-relaxation